tara:strand:- start:20 stop:541 length:522 start_codon:yes stop_codon:yes gene_type:complete
MSEIQVIDNFLDEKDFEGLKQIFYDEIPWTFTDILNEDDLLCDQIYNYQYVHNVYYRQEPVSRYFNNVIPLLTKLDARALVRCKVNSISRDKEIVIHGFHTDMEYPEEHSLGLDGMKTAILYLNTNNGYTCFKEGTKIESVANRCVIFPAHYKHSGTTCTDVPRRLAINLVYF